MMFLFSVILCCVIRMFSLCHYYPVLVLFIWVHEKAHVMGVLASLMPN